MSTQLSKTRYGLELEKHAQALRSLSLVDFFKEEKNRHQSFSRVAAGIKLDFSKQRVTATTLKLLCGLAEEQKLTQHFQNLFSGEFVNTTENRLAFHPLLRMPATTSLAYQEVQASLEKMAHIVSAIHRHQWRGYSDQPITDIVNLGIGGSYLGPALACEALRDFQIPMQSGVPLNIHFVANVHAKSLEHCLRSLNPATTLFLVSSKSFGTLETLTNFHRAKAWIGHDNPHTFRQHFIAMTAQVDKALAQGFPLENIIPFWDWVGGRYSVWSAIGLPVALSIGMQNFQDFLSGGFAMDNHVLSTPAQDNLAMLLALLDIWQINFHHIHNHAILAYHDHLSLLVPHLQQLIMESNGKNKDKHNHPLDYHTAPIVWGGLGSLGQHAYYQLLHQGTLGSLIDFIVVKQTEEEVLTSALSQAQVLMEGDLAPGVVASQLLGNRPSSTLWLEALTPHSLGSLLSLYEHRTFAQAMLWNINPFDQWGVERGKTVQTAMMQQSRAG